jgi:hypothetical protein
MTLPLHHQDDDLTLSQAIFFRVSDRLRLEGYVAGLTQSGMSLSVVSSQDAILDHYGKLLVARLREAAPHIELEVCFPASADALISRFNEVLRTCSIEDAMGNLTSQAPPRIWIVHDAAALPDHEIQLLARLVQNFPGANIRVVMLLAEASQKHQLLSAFGRRFMHWDIEPPTSAQKQALLEQARAQGRETLVNALLKQLVPSDDHAPLPMLPEGNAIQVDPEDVTPNWQAKPERQKWGVWGWVLPISALLLLSGIVLGQLYGGSSIKTKVLESINIDWRRLLPSQALPASAAVGAAPIASAVVAITSPAALPAASMAAPVSPLASASATAVPDQANGAMTATALAALPSVPAASAPGLKALTTPAVDIAPKEEVISTLADQLRAGHAWILSMPTDIFLVLHVTKSSYAVASTWIKDRPELNNLHIVANYPSIDSDLKFSVVSGPFDSRLEAMRYAKNAEMSKGAWAMPLKLMADRLSREPKAVAAAKPKVTR